MKRLLSTIILILLTMAISGISQAKVTGVCSNCHTMHNSQNGQAMATYGSSSPENPGTGPLVSLVRGTCFGCHAQMDGQYIKTDITGSKIPQVYHNNSTRDLAGGNFAYITGHKGTAPSEAIYDAKGHNIIQLGDLDDQLDSPPGDELTTGVTDANLTCAGVYGCHGDRTVSGNWAAMRGSHHTDDSTIDGYTTATSFRFLKGIVGLENNDGDYAWQDYDKDHHNEYKGATGTGTEPTSVELLAGSSISEFCATCHGDFHYSADIDTSGTSPWKRHPTDIALPTTGEYSAYTTYSTVAPIARSTVPGSILDDTTNAVVMCLSCHGAHATDYFKLMRWDYKNWPPGDNGCNVCHTSKD